MVDVATLDIKVNTTDLARGEASLEALQREGAQTEASMRRLGDTARRASRDVARISGASRISGFAAQNAAFQISDFAVQVSSGQSAARAFAQQAPQLAGAFGLWGAALGAVIAVGAGLVPLFLNAKSGAEDLSEALKLLEESTEDASVRLEQLKRGLASVAQTQTALAIDEARRELARLNEELQEYQAQVRGPEALSVLAGTLQSLREQIAAQEEIIRNAEGKLEKDRRAVQEAKNLEFVLSNVRGVLSRVREEAGLTADEFGRAAREAAMIGATGFGKDLLQLPGEGANAATQQQRVEELRKKWAELNRTVSGRASGGGGRAADVFAQRLESLVGSLQTEREIVEAWYNESQAILANQRAQEILGEQGHKEQLLRLEEEYQNRLSALRQAENSARLQSVAGAFADVAALMQTQNKKLFAIGKAAAIAEATVSGYEAAVEAWNKGMKIGGPPAAAAFAAASLARTGALISSIASTSIGGGGTGGAGAGVGSVSGGTSQLVSITLNGSESSMFTMEQVRGLINQINEAVEGGARVRLA